jgi:hypothetical protein
VTNNISSVSRYRMEGEGMQIFDAEMQPFMPLFVKSLTRRKCKFSKDELVMMCKDPLHSPRLILYLIDFIKKI